MNRRERKKIPVPGLTGDVIEKETSQVEREEVISGTAGPRRYTKEVTGGRLYFPAQKPVTVETLSGGRIPGRGRGDWSLGTSGQS